MRKLIFTLLLALLASLVESCGSSDKKTYHGYLYFAQGSYVMMYSLRDGGLTVVTNLGRKTIREISSFGEGRLLISELAAVNQKQIARISWLDVKTGRSDALYAGFRARFLAGAQAIIYDDAEKLYWVYRAGFSEIDSIILAHKRHQLTAMIEVADNSLLLETQEDGQPVVQAYQPMTGELERLDQLAGLCQLQGAVWIGDLEQLACRKRSSEGGVAAGTYVLADIEGNLKAELSLPDGEKFLALTYIGSQSALIFQETWESQFRGKHKSAIWAHDIHSGENQQLSGSQNLGASAVYTEY
jgi:hypothetical protein